VNFLKVIIKPRQPALVRTGIGIVGGMIKYFNACMSAADELRGGFRGLKKKQGTARSRNWTAR